MRKVHSLHCDSPCSRFPRTSSMSEYRLSLSLRFLPVSPSPYSSYSLSPEILHCSTAHHDIDFSQVVIPGLTNTTATYIPHPPPDLPLERGGIGKTSMKVRKTHR